MKNQQLISLEASLTQQKSNLASMLKLYGDNYPEITSLKASISVAEAQKAELEKQMEAQAAANPDRGPVKVSNPGVQARLEELKNSVNTVRTQIQTTQGDIDRIVRNQAVLNQRIAAYQARIYRRAPTPDLEEVDKRHR